MFSSLHCFMPSPLHLHIMQSFIYLCLIEEDFCVALLFHLSPNSWVTLMCSFVVIGSLKRKVFFKRSRLTSVSTQRDIETYLGWNVASLHKAAVSIVTIVMMMSKLWCKRNKEEEGHAGSDQRWVHLVRSQNGQPAVPKVSL